MLLAKHQSLVGVVEPIKLFAYLAAATEIVGAEDGVAGAFIGTKKAKVVFVEEIGVSNHPDLLNAGS